MMSSLMFTYIQLKYKLVGVRQCMLITQLGIIDYAQLQAAINFYQSNNVIKVCNTITHVPKHTHYIQVCTHIAIQRYIK